MKLVVALLTGLLLAASAQAQRIYHQGELDAMLAPIALQPDGVVSQVLIAATYPDEVAEAARWSRANPHLRGEDAARAVQYEPWDPAVKALVAFPELLLRMDESPEWLHDLGQAFQFQQAHVMDTVQSLRRRAQAAGYLSTTDQYAVYPQGEAIVVEPRTQVVYVRYYDPYVVYGPWWWPHYRPVFWRPWAPRPVFVSYGFFYARPYWHARHVHVVHRPVHVHRHHHHVVTGKWYHRTQPHVRVPESQRQPIVRSAPLPAPAPAMRETSTRRVQAPTRQLQSQRQAGPQSPPLPAPSPVMRERRVPEQMQPMPAASGFTQQREHPRVRPEVRREQRTETRREPQNHSRGHQGRWHRS